MAKGLNQRSVGVKQGSAGGDKIYYSSLVAVFCCPSCGETHCSTSRPAKVSEIPTHHSVIWASPKISCPRNACKKWMILTLACVQLGEKTNKQKNKGTWELLSLTDDMKLEAVVVTVVQVEEDEYLSALARKVHITALQVKSSPPHSSLRGIWS